MGLNLFTTLLQTIVFNQYVYVRWNDGAKINLQELYNAD